MSLLSRLVLLVVLALVGLGAAVGAVVRVHRESDAEREATGFAQGESITTALLAKRAALSPDVRDAIAAHQPPPPALASFTAQLLAPLVDASAGYCLPDGTLAVRETVDVQEHSPPPTGSSRFGPRHERDERPPGLLPLDRDVVAAACRAYAPHGAVASHERFVAPNDFLFLTVAGGHAPFAAWALVRSPKRVSSSGIVESLPLVAIIAAAMVALVVVCADTVLQIRRGVGSIADALVAAQVNLAAPMPPQTMGELARIADGLGAMTRHLAGARERELALERSLAHERRLASLGRVAAGVAHEIRNPLAGMKLRLDAMARRRLDERSARDVTRSLAEVARLDAVVSSLLLVARKEPPPLEEVDLAALTDDRIATLQALATARSVRVAREGAARGRVDPAALARVVDNLVRNAIEASPEGGEVVVGLSARGADLVMRVVDSGPGVASARQSELFEPFFTSKPDGTGLGLSLSRAAVEAHGGTLSYERSDGRTSFTVRLPGSAVS